MAGGLQEDVWRQGPVRAGMPAREPGPIDLNRYAAEGGAYAGPLFDPSHPTAVDGLRLSQKAGTAIAMRKSVLSDARHLDPQRSGDGPVLGQHTD